VTATSAGERDVVRELAQRVAAIAADDRMAAIRRRWRDVNALRRPDRAPVWCRPVGCWPELLPEEDLVCTDPYLRSIERGFRQTLVKREIDDDTPVRDRFAVGAVFDVAPRNIWGVDAARHRPAEKDGAWAFDPPLKTPADFNRLQLPAYTYNETRTSEALSRAHDLLGDILPVELECQPPLGASTLVNAAAELRGLVEMMMDTAAEPALLHRLMGHLRDGVLAAMDDVLATGLLTCNHHGPMIESDPIGPEPAGGRVTYANCWQMANSQEFDQVSPAAWETFCLDYQRPILERFGLTAYGCCENLTHKIDGVLSIPNLRIFVSSAWTDLDTVIDRVGADYVIMWRQKASDVVMPHDAGVIRRDLEAGLRRLKGCRVQVVLRELQTLRGRSDRLHVWTLIAKELAAKYA